MNTHPVPDTLKILVSHQRELLDKYQQELFDKLGVANVEIMRMLKLSAEEGWQLDLERMVYVQVPSSSEPIDQNLQTTIPSDDPPVS